MFHIVGLTFLIVLREGLEALLVIAALAAFLMRAGEQHRLNALAWGTALGVIASLAAAWVFEHIFANIDDLTEAFIMLAVAVLLFHVSAWLWRFRNLQAWQRHLEGHVRGALEADSSLMLGGIAFLAVVREGAETILFLYAATDDEIGALPAVVIGTGLAMLALAACYWAMTRLALRLPLRPLFAVTSLFLFVLGLRFVGAAIDEFQVVGWLPDDQVSLPGWLVGLGINPSLQSLGLQLVLIVVFAALFFTQRQPQRGDKLGNPDKAT